MDHLAGWTVLPDTTDGAAMAEQARRLDQDEPFVGVLCWDEARIHAAAQVAQALGLPNGDPAVIGRLRDKGQTRQALAAAGLAQPRSIPVATVEQALAAAEQVGYPAILKPRGLGASLGVIRVNDADQLRARFAFTLNTRSPEPEDVRRRAAGAGRGVRRSARRSAWTRSIADGEVTAALRRPQGGRLPAVRRGDRPLRRRRRPAADRPGAGRAAAGLPHRRSASPTAGRTAEFMLTASGPKLIEVNGRLGGDLIP